MNKHLMEIQEMDNNAAAICRFAIGEDLLDSTQPAYGIARMLAEGKISLTNSSEKQQAVYRKYIEPLGNVICKQCGEAISPEELEFSVNSGGLCSHCAHLYEDEA